MQIAKVFGLMTAMSFMLVAFGSYMVGSSGAEDA
jgi:hypothetical protein